MYDGPCKYSISYFFQYYLYMVTYFLPSTCKIKHCNMETNYVDKQSNQNIRSLITLLSYMIERSPDLTFIWDFVRSFSSDLKDLILIRLVEVVCQPNIFILHINIIMLCVNMLQTYKCLLTIYENLLVSNCVDRKRRKNAFLRDVRTRKGHNNAK